MRARAGARPRPTAGCLEGEYWSWDPEASAPCCWGASQCSELAPDSVRTGTSSEPTSCPRSGGRRACWAVSALCSRALVRRKRVKGLNYVLSRKGFCSERQAGQMCKFRASRRKTKRVGSWPTALKSVSDAPGDLCPIPTGASGTSLTFH